MFVYIGCLFPNRFIYADWLIITVQSAENSVVRCFIISYNITTNNGRRSRAFETLPVTGHCLTWTIHNIPRYKFQCTNALLPDISEETKPIEEATCRMEAHFFKHGYQVCAETFWFSINLHCRQNQRKRL